MKHKLNPVLDAQLNRNRQRRGGHRRNFSDGRISSTVTDHLGDDVSRDDETDIETDDHQPVFSSYFA